MLSHPSPAESPEASELRGSLFTDLDRLAFALEMEAAELVTADRLSEASTVQHLRLGVRLAQRLVAGVWADEVHERMRKWSDAYESRMGKVA
jgi:hypothetical protein